MRVFHRDCVADQAAGFGRARGLALQPPREELLAALRFVVEPVLVRRAAGHRQVAWLPHPDLVRQPVPDASRGDPWKFVTAWQPGLSFGQPGLPASVLTAVRVCAYAARVLAILW